MDFEKLSQKNIDRLGDEELADKFEMEDLTEKQFEKPKVLYRGLREKNIQESSPSFNTKIRDKNEGQVVFVTPDKAFAMMFLVPEADDSWTIKGRINGQYYTVIADKEIYKKLDKGGSVYEIRNLDDFYCDKNKGMGECEWISRKSVEHASEEQFDSALKAMIDSGVKVYFVDKETFVKIKNADDHGISILSKLQPEK